MFLLQILARIQCAFRFLVRFFENRIMTIPDLHPHILKRRNRVVLNDISSTVSLSTPQSNIPKKLKRMPHVFARVLELPCDADFPVEICENKDFLKFSVQLPGLVSDDVKAEVIVIVPGVVKVMVAGIEELVEDMVTREAPFWRCRLPPSTIPEFSSASYESEALVVIVPKITCTEMEDMCRENKKPLIKNTEKVGT